MKHFLPFHIWLNIPKAYVNAQILIWYNEFSSNSFHILRPFNIHNVKNNMYKFP